MPWEFPVNEKFYGKLFGEKALTNLNLFAIFLLTALLIRLLIV